MKTKPKTIDPRKIAFDIDGVIADTMGLFIDILHEHYNVHTVHYEDITDYQLEDCLDLDPEVMAGAVDRIMDGNYRPILKPMDGAGRVLRRIGGSAGRILLITARHYAGPMGPWIEELLDGHRENSEIVATGAFDAKIDVLMQNGIDWFMEDRLETCHLLQEAGIAPIVFNQPWNSRPHDYLSVDSWAQLEQWIDF